MGNLDSVKKTAYDLAYFYEQKYGCCSQCVLGAIKNTIGNISDEVFKSSTGLAAGLSGGGYACGALTGGIMALSCYLGREINNFPDPDGIRFRTFDISRRLVSRFEQEYGERGGDCAVIQKCIMGRSYDILKGERDQFLEDGGHDDKCPAVCGNAAVWVIEILEEEGLI